MTYTEIEFLNVETGREEVITIAKGDRVDEIIKRKPKKGKYVLLVARSYDDINFETVREVAA